jgi:hypothetical protein
MTEVEGFGFVKLPLEHGQVSGNFDSLNRQFRTQLQNLQSTLRKAKLLKQTRESGEQQRIAESTDTWKDVIGQVIPKLKEHCNQECSMGKFAKKILKIDLNHFGIELDEDGESVDDEEEEESSHESQESQESQDKENYQEAKRFKYDE